MEFAPSSAKSAKKQRLSSKFDVWRSSWKDLLSGESDTEASPGRPVVRNTKIICTLGPSSDSVEKISLLLRAGMNVARLNFSHGDHKSHLQTVNNIRQAVKETGIVCAILLDNKGPEIRTGLLVGGGEIQIKKGSEFNLVCNADMQTFKGDAKQISCDYKDLPSVIKVGASVKIDDGLILCECIEADPAKHIVRVRALNDAMLGQRKGINLPGTKVTLPSLTEQDKKDLLFGVEHEVDFIAMSFCRRAEDVIEVKKILASKEGGEGILVISKIENQQGVDNFDAILEASDGIMVARGDLGVEIQLSKVIVAQKMMIAKCNLAKKPVITATQMLESMVVNPRPTRAEATDVANAVLDGTDCVMLSGETAKGAYPIIAVETMALVVTEAERLFDQQEWFHTMAEKVHKRLANRPMTVTEVCCSGAVRSVHQLQAAGIVVVSQSGSSARAVAKYKPGVPIVVISQVARTARQLLISYGVHPHHAPIQHNHLGGTLLKGIDYGKKIGWFREGDTVVLVKGIDGVCGSTNTVQIAEI
eukprot:gb/GEZN01002984.1/.p1 GENE.gb/GEZN01002984.1/~~gb/GEZN01002984.1/.p1  ORF type:complete len:532 (-),score=97.11 gb/GEZN01002984.1/:569-2164(-)